MRPPLRSSSAAAWRASSVGWRNEKRGHEGTEVNTLGVIREIAQRDDGFQGIEDGSLPVGKVVGAEEAREA